MSSGTKYRYAAEDLEPRDPVAEEAWLEAWIERNRDALNTSIAKADEEFACGKYFALDEVMAELEARRAARKP